eukprot:scaffold3203_cov95-Skeletonema_dohrnii-CCMP3373.AAC.1
MLAAQSLRLHLKHSRLEDDSDSDGSDSDSDSDSSSSSSCTSQTNKIDRTALTSELATSNIDTTGLSDYELIRLRNIKRNEAKLRSLGLFSGITSKANNGGGNDGNKSERVKKAAETRRRNKMLARERVERHDREMEELRRRKHGDDSYGGADDSKNSHGRVQPQRTAKAITTSYSTKAIVPSKRRIQWETNLSSLRSFHKQFGTFQISATQHGSEYKSLQQWKCRQRKEYLLFKEGRKSVLDEEQVTLLEQLGGDWLVGSKRGGGGRGRSVNSVSSVSMTRSRRRTTRQSSNLWTDYSDDDDYEEEEKMMAEWEEEGTEDQDEDGGDEVVIGSSDSFSIVSEESEEKDKHQYAKKKKQKSSRAYYSESDKDHYGKKRRSLSREHDSESDESEAYSSEEESLQRLPPKQQRQQQQQQQQQHRRSKSTLRRSRQMKRAKKRNRGRRDDSPPVKRSKHRLVSSLEVVAPAEIESNWSSPPLKRSRTYEDDYMTPHRSSRRRMSTYSLREEESIVSAEETSFQAGSSRRRRKRYVHQRSSRRDEGYEEVFEKPMDEIIVRDDIDSMQAERDKLMAEYGALYGRKCVILEKRDQVEKELRGMEFARKLLADASDS